MYIPTYLRHLCVRPKPRRMPDSDFWISGRSPTLKFLHTARLFGLCPPTPFPQTKSIRSSLTYSAAIQMNERVLARQREVATESIQRCCTAPVSICLDGITERLAGGANSLRSRGPDRTISVPYASSRYFAPRVSCLSWDCWGLEDPAATDELG